MSQALPSFPELADVRAKYGPVMHGDLRIDLESGNITGDGPMLAFWESLVDYFRATIRGLEAENAKLREIIKAYAELLDGMTPEAVAEANAALAEIQKRQELP